MLLAGAVPSYLNLLKNEHDTTTYTLLKVVQKNVLAVYSYGGVFMQ